MLYEQIDHALDIKARIQDYIAELDSMKSLDDIPPSQVSHRLNNILARAEAATRLKQKTAWLLPPDLGNDA